MSSKIRLVVEEIKHLPACSHGRNLIVQVEWRESEKKYGVLPRLIKKRNTCQQRVQETSSVSWNEVFDQSYRSWIIGLQIQEVQQKPREKKQIIGKVKFDVAEISHLKSKKSIQIPISCSFEDYTADAMLMVKVQLINVDTEVRCCSHIACTKILKPFREAKVGPEENFQSLGLENNNLFMVGGWERRKIISRDGEKELGADVFLASTDQRSKKAAGGGACTVLAAVIADWLHNNPHSLPLRWQFDKLIKKGSREWRKLCADENHKVKFSDMHFDLDTVLEAKIRPLRVITEKSYVGFFHMDEMPKAEMSFDSIWKELLHSNISESRLYITSWNDHFFVLKVDNDAIYLIDTLGERLYEGCSQAYILKFDAESIVYSHDKQVICKGIACCQEYFKGFLSALPIRQLQEDIRRGKAREELIYRILQIDFHYTAPI